MDCRYGSILGNFQPHVRVGFSGALHGLPSFHLIVALSVAQYFLVSGVVRHRRLLYLPKRVLGALLLLSERPAFTGGAATEYVLRTA
jgi:hypothetical protein